MASISKQVCQSNQAQPSHSLIKTISYPEIFKFSNAATEHGCKHEKEALATYVLTMKANHVNFQVNGMIVNQQCPSNLGQGINTLRHKQLMLSFMLQTMRSLYFFLVVKSCCCTW